MEQARKRGLARLMLRWPERRAELRLCYSKDPGFADLCDAYETACDAALYWGKSMSPIGPERAEEYRALMTATEQDILHRLS
jgi:hypothetical protein